MSKVLKMCLHHTDAQRLGRGLKRASDSGFFDVHVAPIAISGPSGVTCPWREHWVKVGLVEPAVVTWMAAQHFPGKCTTHKSTSKRGAGPGRALAFHSWSLNLHLNMNTCHQG